jgi:aspartyl-tRNA(Asn)/glutamyl-tRNA(Gln) amidotransferase subunit B
VFDGVWSGAGEVDQIIKERGLKQVSDNGALEQLVADVLAKNPAMIDDYIATEEGRRKKKLGGFMGQIMQASKGQANPKQVNQILLAQLQSLSGSRGD